MGHTSYVFIPRNINYQRRTYIKSSICKINKQLNIIINPQNYLILIYNH